MSNTKQTRHTPGPWIPEKSEYGYWVRATDSTQKPVADVHLFCVDNREPKVWSHEETFSNVTLIAAAPEMLEALLRVQGNNKLMNALNEQDRKTLELIQSAIAKAEGRDR